MSVKATSEFLHVKSGDYPLSLRDIRRRHPDTSLPVEPTEVMLAGLGYAPVEPTAPPQGDVVELGTPKASNGKYQQNWVVRDFTDDELAERLEEKRQELKFEVDQERDRRLEQGVIFEFEEGTYEHIQLRPEDRINYLGLRMEAQEVIAMGVEGVKLPLRTYENTTWMLSPERIVEATNLALVTFKQIYSDAWALKDQIRFASTHDELPSLESGGR